MRVSVVRRADGDAEVVVRVADEVLRVARAFGQRDSERPARRVDPEEPGTLLLPRVARAALVHEVHFVQLQETGAHIYCNLLYITSTLTRF